MIQIYYDKEKYKQGVLLTNYLTEILNKKKVRQYNSKKIDGLLEIIQLGNSDNIIKYLFDNKISLKEAVPVNYRQIQIIYENNHNIEDIKDFLQYKLLKKEINLIIKKPDFVIDFLKNIYKQQSRKKGNLFRELFLFLNQNIKHSLPEMYFNMEDIMLLNNMEDFVYIPEDDTNTKKILDFFNIKYKSQKGRDCLIRLNGIYYLVEAKEIGEEGGSQNSQFKNILSCIDETNSKENLIGIGIIYGASLFYKNKYQKIIDINPNIIPLSEFIYNFEHSLKYTLKKL